MCSQDPASKWLPGSVSRSASSWATLRLSCAMLASFSCSARMSQGDLCYAAMPKQEQDSRLGQFYCPTKPPTCIYLTPLPSSQAGDSPCWCTRNENWRRGRRALLARGGHTASEASFAAWRARDRDSCPLASCLAPQAAATTCSALRSLANSACSHV